MGAGIFIELNILSAMICIMLFYQQKRHKVFDFLGSTAFNSILWTTVLILVSDTASWLIIADLVHCGDMALKLFQSLYYLLQALLPMFFFGYCLEVSDYPARGVWAILMYVPVVLTGLLLIANFEGGTVFCIVEGHIKRGSGFLLAMIAPAIYVINSLILCIYFYARSRMQKNEKKRMIALHILVAIVISAIGALLSAFSTAFNPWHVFVTALVYLYIRLHGFQEFELSKRAFTDSLTGLKNHAAYAMIKERMDQRMRKETDMHFAVAIMDVNGLKQVNDAYGHEAGDALIIAAGKLVCDVFDHSPVCRIGGDEFIAILEKSDYENREALREEFVRQMKSRYYTVGTEQMPISAALGIVEYDPEQHKVFENVFHAADEAMYQNKATIKNIPRN